MGEIKINDNIGIGVNRNPRDILFIILINFFAELSRILFGKIFAWVENIETIANHLAYLGAGLFLVLLTM